MILDRRGRINMESRLKWIDYVKVLGCFFVLVLHINNYALDCGGNSFSDIQIKSVYAVNAVAYCAIHLFVMAGSYTMQTKIVRLKSYIQIYVQTLMVCIIGLVISFMFRLDKPFLNILQCVLPFTFHAYWFVSAYLVFMLLTPYLNRLIEKLNRDSLYTLTAILYMFFSVLPVLPGRFGWKSYYSEITLFVLLYFLVAWIRLGNIKIKSRFLWGGYGLAAVTLFSSYMLLVKIGYENTTYMYAYYNPLVIIEAVCLFMIFKNMNVNVNMNKRKSIIDFLVPNTLICYLLHMHPVIKNNYVQLGVLNWTVDTGILYSIAIFLTAFIGLFILSALGTPIRILSLKAANWLENKVILFKDKREKSR